MFSHLSRVFVCLFLDFTHSLCGGFQSVFHSTHPFTIHLLKNKNCRVQIVSSLGGFRDCQATTYNTLAALARFGRWVDCGASALAAPAEDGVVAAEVDLRAEWRAATATVAVDDEVGAEDVAAASSMGSATSVAASASPVGFEASACNSDMNLEYAHFKQAGAANEVSYRNF
jgi:hypothetical protein